MTGVFRHRFIPPPAPRPSIGRFGKGAISLTGYSISEAVSASTASAVYGMKSTAQSASRDHAQPTFVRVLQGYGLGNNRNNASVTKNRLLLGTSRGKSADQARTVSIFSARGNSAGKYRAAAQLFELPPVLIRREFAAFMRFTGYNYGSTEKYRAAAWHDPLIVDLPQPEESLRDEFGIQSGDTLEVTVADTALRTTLEGGTLDGASVVLEWVTTSHYVIGDPVEDVFTRTYTVKGYTYRSGLVTLRLVNIEDVRLSSIYPTLVFGARDWPEIFPEHVGRAVPVAVGTAVKIPCTLIKTAAGVGPWKFAVCHPTATVLTVYRNGRVVAASE